MCNSTIEVLLIIGPTPKQIGSLIGDNQPVQNGSVNGTDNLTVIMKLKDSIKSFMSLSTCKNLSREQRFDSFLIATKSARHLCKLISVLKTQIKRVKIIFTPLI